MFGPGVRLLRARPGDTLVVTSPVRLSPVEEFLLRRELEDCVGYRADVRIVFAPPGARVAVVRELT